GQRPHRAREGRVRGTARSARRDGRCGEPSRLLADDRGDRRLTTTASKATESACVERTGVGQKFCHKLGGKIRDCEAPGVRPVSSVYLSSNRHSRKRNGP